MLYTHLTQGANLKCSDPLTLQRWGEGGEAEAHLAAIRGTLSGRSKVAEHKSYRMERGNQTVPAKHLLASNTRLLTTVTVLSMCCRSENSRCSWEAREIFE